MANKKDFFKNQTDIQLAYLAGIIDGEGCFYVGYVYQPNQSSTHHWHTLVKISNNEKSLMDWLEVLFNRKIEKRYKYQSKRINEKPTYSFNLSGQLLDFILPKIMPFLIIKKEHAKIMLEIRKTFYNRGSHSISNEEMENRLTLMKKMRSLNTRFHGHPLKN